MIHKLPLSSLILTLAFSLSCFLGGCSSTQNAQPQAYENQAKQTDTNAVDSKNGNLTLIDYLRREPSLRISGNHPDPHIMVRGAQSISGENQPLFVVDGNQIGNSYQQVIQAVDIADIKSIHVLKDVSSTSIYGMRGANGVIEIKTKKGK